MSTARTPHSSRARRALGTLAGPLALTGLTALAGTADAATTPASAASPKGRHFGTAVAAGHLGETDCANTLNTESDQVTPENEMKWDAVEATRGSP